MSLRDDILFILDKGGHRGRTVATLIERPETWGLHTWSYQGSDPVEVDAEITRMVQEGILTEAKKPYPPFSDQPGWMVVTAWMPRTAQGIQRLNQEVS